VTRVDLRFITATNKDLQAALKDGGFREDLFYRINVITIQLPPLRERREDLPLLVGHFLQKYSSDISKDIKEVSPEALSLMSGYHWPGNIRELQNVVERAVLISEGNTILPEHLPENVRGMESFLEEYLGRGLSIEEYTQAFIKKYQHAYSEQEIADRLGITRKTLWEKRKKWGLKRPSLQTVTDESD
jgi:DNA-binding NtrC family response regulator